jgi:hypothetical protein
MTAATDGHVGTIPSFFVRRNCPSHLFITHTQPLTPFAMLRVRCVFCVQAYPAPEVRPINTVSVSLFVVDPELEAIVVPELFRCARVRSLHAALCAPSFCASSLPRCYSDWLRCDTHTHRHAHTQTHRHAHTRTHTHAHTHTRTHTHTHARTHTHTHTHARTHTSHHVVANALHAALTSGCCLLRLPPSPSASWLCPTLPSLRSQGLC